MTAVIQLYRNDSQEQQLPAIEIIARMENKSIFADTIELYSTCDNFQVSLFILNCDSHCTATLSHTVSSSLEAKEHPAWNMRDFPGCQ